MNKDIEIKTNISLTFRKKAILCKVRLEDLYLSIEARTESDRRTDNRWDRKKKLKIKIRELTQAWKHQVNLNKFHLFKQFLKLFSNLI